MSSTSFSSGSPNPSPPRSTRWARGQVLGCGGFGVVYLATYTNPDGLRQRIAVKTALAEESSTLRKEKRVLEYFRGCPEILTCYSGEESVERGKKLYNLLLEYAPAGALDDLIARSYGSVLPENEVRAYTRMILKGLDCVHAKGFVHCDIKPGNILAFPRTTSIDQSCKYQLKIADFGLAKKTEQMLQREASMGGFQGTPEYMSPELALLAVIGPALDVWSLGCTVVEMIIGKNPWHGVVQPGSTLPEFIHLLVNKAPEIPERMSESGKDFLRKCFRRDPKERWSARMLLNHPYVSGFASDTPQDPRRVDRKDDGGNVAPRRGFLLPHEMMNGTV